jgi:uncharacterized protein
MYLMKLLVSEFTQRANNLWRDLQERFEAAHGYRAGDSEVKSWRKSLPALADVLRGTPKSVQECLVYLEYGMPSSSSRADAVIAGLDPNGYRCAVVIELKQWDASSVIVDRELLKVGGKIQPHPSDQALGYREYLEDLSEAFADTYKTIRSGSYLHNALSHSLGQLTQYPFAKLTEISPLFAADQKDQMAEWISDVLVQRPDSNYVVDLDSGTLKVSKNLFTTVARAVKEEPAWTLLDEQRAVYKQILDLVNNDDGEAHLVLVTGGPGTGKSVIAMQLMGELSRRGVPTAHVTNSRSFTTVMQSLIQRRRDPLWGTRAVQGLFRLSHSWVKRKDRFDVVLCDEAHRFRRSTTLFPYLVSNRPQAEEILEYARIMVAFIDDKQRLRKAEEGTVDYFRRCATQVGVQPKNIHGPIELTAQFRAAGNSDFVKVLDKALYEEIPTGFSHRNFALQVHDSVEDLEAYLQDKIDGGYSARLLAGFCWEWSDPNYDGTLVHDVQVGHWSRPWNRKAGNRTYPPDQHPYAQWANRVNNQLTEVGCIYSVQGFEFDYIGVVWGLDLVWRGDRWVAQPEKSFDPEMRRGKKPISEQIALPLLKNAYRVLCSRAMRGCSIFCLDEETAEYLRQALDQPSQPVLRAKVTR